VLFLHNLGPFTFPHPLTFPLPLLHSHVKHLKGQSNLKTFSMRDTIWNHTEMTNFFCDTCGTLMYRRNPEDFPGLLIPRIGTLDDLSLMETTFKPRVEQYEKDRASWLKPVEGAEVRTQKMNMDWGMGKGKKAEEGKEKLTMG